MCHSQAIAEISWKIGRSRTDGDVRVRDARAAAHDAGERSCAEEIERGADTDRTGRRCMCVMNVLLSAKPSASQRS